MELMLSEAALTPLNGLDPMDLLHKCNHCPLIDEVSCTRERLHKLREGTASCRLHPLGSNLLFLCLFQVYQYNYDLFFHILNKSQWEVDSFIFGLSFAMFMGITSTRNNKQTAV